MALAARIEEGRAALAGRRSAAIRVLGRRDGARGVAFLLTLGRRDGELLFPLREGTSFVGRGAPDREPFEPAPPPRVLEQAQWHIRCSAGDARIIDAASTNLSVLCPRGTTLPPEGGFGWTEASRLPGAIVLPHLNTLASPGERDVVDAAFARGGVPLHESDLLRTAYAWFVFAWAGT